MTTWPGGFCGSLRNAPNDILACTGSRRHCVHRSDATLSSYQDADQRLSSPELIKRLNKYWITLNTSSDSHHTSASCSITLPRSPQHYPLAVAFPGVILASMGSFECSRCGGPNHGDEHAIRAVAVNPETVKMPSHHLLLLQPMVLDCGKDLRRNAPVGAAGPAIPRANQKPYCQLNCVIIDRDN